MIHAIFGIIMKSFLKMPKLKAPYKHKNTLSFQLWRAIVYHRAYRHSGAANPGILTFAVHSSVCFSSGKKNSELCVYDFASFLRETE